MNFIFFFERDLKKLEEEINLYKKEEDLWKVVDGINNSGGNLALHLVGNLNQFIGKTLGNTDYVRDRDYEFSARNVSREEIIKGINNVSEVIKKTLSTLSEADLEKQFSVKINNHSFTTEEMLLHLATHLSYHLGQINYHRRILSEEK